MKARETSPNGLTVRAIAGTHVVLLGFDIKPEQRKGLLGFAVYRKNLTPQGDERVEGWLGGGLTFPETDPPGNPRFQDLDYANKCTNRFPIQRFRWGDYTARPDHKYLYRVQAMYLKDGGKAGEPDALEARDEVAVTVRTEDPADVGKNNGRQQVHFNRSAASSQAFVREFPNIKPNVQEDQLPPEAQAWLSRGLEEALVAFIGKAADKNNSLHLCVYEFQKDSFLAALAQAAGRGVELEIIYDSIQSFVKRDAKGAAAGEEEDAGGAGAPAKTPSRQKPTPEFLATQAKYPGLVIDPEDNLPRETGPRKANDKAIEKHNLRKYCHKRQGITSISHNKFVVLCQQGKPVAVWTGSTNFTDGAVYGQLNVGHAIWDATLAQQYYNLHQKLLLDSDLAHSRQISAQISPVPPEVAIQEGQTGLYPCFSPRATQIAIDTCVRLLRGAKEMVCLTAPFPLQDDLRKALDNPDDRFIKFALLNHDSDVLIKDGKASVQTGQVTRQEHMPAHLYYAGASSLNLTEKKSKEEKVTGAARTDASPLDKVQERMLLDVKTQGRTDAEIHAEIEALKQQGFASENMHHQGAYIHTKILLADPFSDYPIVVTGSANFSANSCQSNDENQLYLFGESAVADVYVSEFMRMYDHYEMRDRLNRGAADGSSGFLKTDDSWTVKYFDPADGGTGEKQADRQVFSGATLSGG